MACVCFAFESPYLYGIHDHTPDQTEYLTHITNATGAGGWITATVAVGANTNDFSGANFTALANARHTIICRINYSYFPDGTIPITSKYDDFAVRCRNFVASSSGCNIWLIGNEVNLAVLIESQDSEWRGEVCVLWRGGVRATKFFRRPARGHRNYLWRRLFRC